MAMAARGRAWPMPPSQISTELVKGTSRTFKCRTMPYSSAAGQPDEGPTIQTLEQFKTVTTLSLNTPIIVYATDGSDDAVDRELVAGVHGTGGAIKLARLDATAPELAPLRGQLHLNDLPSTLVLFGGRLMDAYPGVPRGQELEQYLAQILRLADDVAAHRAAQQAQQRPADAAPPPAELLVRARAALDDAAADVQTAALPLLQEVLAEGSVASDRERCAAYAGAARCAMAQGDLESAAALVDAARSLLAEDARPPEVEQAALYLDLYREARELGALGAADDEAEAMASKVRDVCVV